MAIEVFPDSPTLGMSPRISFSHDLPQADVVPIEQYIRSGSSSSIDFDFCVFRESFDQDSSSADELFFDGKILPIEIKKRLATPRTVTQRPPTPTSRRALHLPPAFPPPQPSHPPPPPHRITKNNTATATHETEEKQYKTSSFWGFKRSTSLNCGSGYARTLCPLPLLSRSNSTGSTASSKRSLSSNQKQNFPRNAASSFSTAHQKPPLKKNNHHPYSSGIKINPVLNVPHANLFGLGSIFSGGKDYKIKKKH